MEDHPKCDQPFCQHAACFEYTVQWRERGAGYNVWRACAHHRESILRTLRNGVWSGGVPPLSVLESRPVEW